MSDKYEDDEYEFSSASEAAIKFWYPETMTPFHPKFNDDMVLLQLELLKNHSYLMSPIDKDRALKTARVLRAKLKGQEVAWDA